MLNAVCMWNMLANIRTLECGWINEQWDGSYAIRIEMMQSSRSLTQTTIKKKHMKCRFITRLLRISWLERISKEILEQINKDQNIIQSRELEYFIR